MKRLIIMLLCLSLLLCGCGKLPAKQTETTEATQTTTEATTQGTGETAGTTEPTVPATTGAADPAVVATTGELVLTNEAFQFWYWTEVYNFLNQYSYYLSAVGLDVSQPLSQQDCTLVEDMTWEQYFVEAALSSWNSIGAMRSLAHSEGYVFSQDLQDQLDSLPQQLQTQAEEAGYESYDQLIVTQMGPYATTQGAVDYLTDYFMGNAYYAHLTERYTLADENVETYYNEHEAELTEAGKGKDAGNKIDIRHILIQPEGGILNEDGRTYTYTDEQWAAAKAQADEIYEQWLAGDATEDSFAEAAKTYSVDGSANNGGLYTGVLPGQMVTNFNDWCFDESRQVGDHGIVQTEFGYHIMYFSGAKPIWIDEAKAAYQQEQLTAVLEQALADYPIQVDYEQLTIGQVDLVSEGQ